MRKVLTIALFVSLSQVAQASDCIPDDQTQTNLNICALEDYEKADKKLNQAYKKLKNVLLAENMAKAKKHPTF
jgi:uncharacterized protein YecT (DUF1311 family)